MEWPGASKVRRREVPWLVSRLAREFVVAALSPTSQPEAEGGSRHRTVCAVGGQRFGISPGAAVSRGSLARQFARCGAALGADGGGRPNTSGTMGTGARNIVANSAGRSRLR